MADTKALTVSNIVVYDRGDIYTTTRIIAECCDIKHDSIKRLVRNHKQSFLKLGELRGFQIREMSKRIINVPTPKINAKKKRGRPEEEIGLNEEQAHLLMTFLDNKPIVVAFKELLVKEFFRLKAENTLLKKRHASKDWNDIRIEGKGVHLRTCDALKAYSAYAIEQGSSLKDGQYMLIMKMIKKALFDVDKGILNFRDYLNEHQLHTVAVLEELIERIIAEGLMAQRHYKEIRESIRAKIEAFGEVVGRTAILCLTERDQMLLI